MKTKLLATVLLVVLAVTASCAPQRTLADDYFKAAMAGKPPYPLPGVSGFKVQAYEIINASNDVVSVRVTFAGKMGNDVVQTKKFKIAGGKLASTDRSDIRNAIERNLKGLAAGVGMMVLEDFQKPDSKITFERLTAAKMVPYGFAPVEGEDYSKLVVTKIPSPKSAVGGFEMTINDADGEPVSYREQ